MPESGTYQLPPKSLKWESGQDGRYQTVYLPVTILETGKISWSIWPTEKAGRAVGRDSQIVACQLARCRSAEGCGSPAATSKGHRPFEAPTEPTGETSSLQGSRVKPLPSNMMLCVISYWVLFGAKTRQIQQLRCCVLPRQAVETEECLSEINTTQWTSRNPRHLQPQAQRPQFQPCQQ